MPVTVPTRTDLPYYDLQIALDSVTYTLNFRWNVRLGAWFMGVLDLEGINWILAPARVVVDIPLFQWITGRMPPGAFVAIDTTGSGIDPGLNELGSRVQLVYYARSELGL